MKITKSNCFFIIMLIIILSSIGIVSASDINNTNEVTYNNTITNLQNPHIIENNGFVKNFLGFFKLYYEHPNNFVLI